MERKSRKASRIILSVLIGALASLPAAAKLNTPCKNGYEQYATVSFHSTAPEYLNREHAADVCLGKWSSTTTYSNAGGAVDLLFSDPYYNTWTYACLKCRGAFGPYHVALDAVTACNNALITWPGKVIGANLGELTGENGAIQYVYNVDVEQTDSIVRVSVDATTGEVLDLPPLDPTIDP